MTQPYRRYRCEVTHLASCVWCSESLDTQAEGCVLSSFPVKQQHSCECGGLISSSLSWEETKPLSSVCGFSTSVKFLVCTTSVCVVTCTCIKDKLQRVLLYTRLSGGHQLLSTENLHESQSQEISARLTRLSTEETICF